MRRVKRVPVRRVEMQPVETHIKKVETVEAYPKKTTSIRTELSDGCYMVTYYYRRGPYGELLAEIQRITSEGDYKAAKEMVETYAVKVNQDLHKEILARYRKLNLAPYKGFVNPVYTAVRDEAGNITDVRIDFTEGYIDQHLRYSRDYSPLPDVN